jgi:hypothetical protein
MKATLKSMVVKGMTAGLLAGAFLFAAPKKADAQQFAIGVQIGRPVVYPDYYARRDYYDRLRWEEARRDEIARREAFIRQQEWLRHEQRERMHSYAPYPYRYGYYGR